ncbi:hypothetical protein [Sinorhizobium fredii]|uniref:hypothetical protein n=1 Tax=Rhizobium fredii TaxID=380 RepID=UPI00138B0FF3|nr:hypothetical protein [Sinorhizobium fredii]
MRVEQPHRQSITANGDKEGDQHGNICQPCDHRDKVPFERARQESGNAYRERSEHLGQEKTFNDPAKYEVANFQPIPATESQEQG